MNTVQNGKGDKWRKTDFKVYYKNFDEINWSGKKKANVSGTDKVTQILHLSENTLNVPPMNLD